MNIDDRDRPSISSGAGMATNNGKYRAAEKSQEPGPLTAFLSEQPKELGNLALTFDEQAMMKAISRMNFEDTEEMKPFPEVAAKEQSAAKDFNYVDIDEGRCNRLFVCLPITTIPIILVVPFVSTVHTNIFMRNPIFFCTSFSVKVVYDGRARPGIRSFGDAEARFIALNQSIPVCHITSMKIINSVRVRSHCKVDTEPKNLIKNARQVWARKGPEEMAMIAALIADPNKKEALALFEENLSVYRKLQLFASGEQLRKVLLFIAYHYTKLFPESSTPQVHSFLDDQFFAVSH
ncbi:unnamed protein product [Gongylonema pulchrum]|uniref:DUF4476 domain-containing protein n=1 Tax=Gongylonema pulchrum TaxID=637853 RepID=A0A183EEE2_9BILA|nr:unnamed protein product [Gongylonema pulchrum]